MKIAILKERRANETRVAGSPDTVKKFVDLGIDVVVEKGAGAAASLGDDAFKAAGATIAANAKAALKDADLVLKVRRPMTAEEGEDELANFADGQALCCHMEALTERSSVEALAKAGVTGFALELMPRISRAQSMDILSSQSNLAGYKAVLDAASEFGRAFPMMMTAAGTVPPARVLIMGVGVAGLQAIATAKRLGAIVSATDVRPATKEQVESLGGTFVAVEDEEFAQAQTAGGYAKEMSDAYKQKQAALIAETIVKQDIVITTAGLHRDRSCGRGGRQLRRGAARQGCDQAWRPHRRASERARSYPGRCEQAVLPQHPEFPDTDDRCGQQVLQDRHGGRDRCRHVDYPRRQGCSSDAGGKCAGRRKAGTGRTRHVRERRRR
jgi:NAD/NADP transhydrogenase alpha subunit